MSKKVFRTWEDVNSLLDTIHQQSKGEINFVTGVPRGGTILAVLYSHRFNVEYMDYRSNKYTNLLILDDISDSGETFTKLKEEYDIPKYAALHYKETSNFKPDYFAKKIHSDFGWIVYPWERLDSETVQDYLLNQK